MKQRHSITELTQEEINQAQEGPTNTRPRNFLAMSPGRSPVICLPRFRVPPPSHCLRSLPHRLLPLAAVAVASAAALRPAPNKSFTDGLA
jgi:hypothetical protein